MQRRTHHCYACLPAALVLVVACCVQPAPALAAAPAAPRYEIAFASLGPLNSELFIADADGSNAQRLTNEPDNDAHCAWSPDGEWLAFTSARGGFKDESVLHPYNGQPNADIYVMRADGTDVRQLTDTPFEEGTVAWAPLRR